VTRISSQTTFFYKRVFPIMWFGFLAVFLVIALLGGGSPFPFVLVPVLMGGFGYFFFKRFVFDLADEVLDGGDYLVVKKAGEEARVALRDIVNVSYAALQNPSRVTLSLHSPCMFGDEISFVVPATFGAPFRKSPIVADLIKRVDDARRRDF